MSEELTISKTDSLLIVDVQNDFCTGGALPVPRGEEIVPTINHLASAFPHVILTQDWHPRGHLSFASSHPGAKPFAAIATSYGWQTLWPDHCIQESAGAQFRSDLVVPHAALIIRKGLDLNIDSYSAFRENDRRTKTGLAGYLRERGIKRIFIAGLAFDYCVRYSAEDAQAEGFSVLVIEDACRAIDANGSLAAANASLGERGIPCISATAVRGSHVTR